MAHLGGPGVAREQVRLDARVGFPGPACCACEVRAAFAGLLGHARS